MRFKVLFEEFMQARTEFYAEMKSKIGGLKIHVPIPITEIGAKYSLGALVHGLWGTIYLGRPHMVLRVSNEGVEYIRYGEEIESLKDWKGPIFDQNFLNSEERLLNISVSVFDLYVSNTRTDLVEEYAERFFSITPAEFLLYYKRLDAHFLDWITK